MSVTVEFTRVFKSGAADQQELLTLLELLLNEPAMALAMPAPPLPNSAESAPSETLPRTLHFAAL
jgi:hypothetical protein